MDFKLLKKSTVLLSLVNESVARMTQSRNYYIAVVLSLTVVMNLQCQSVPIEKTIRFLALGDSYTIGESVAEDQRWPAQLTSKLAHKGYTIEKYDVVARTGWRTDDLRHAVEASHLPKDYNMVSLLIGVNNQYQGKELETYKVEFAQLLDIAITYAGGKKGSVFVVSIPDYGYTPFGKPKQQQITREIDAFNKANKSISEQKGVIYIDITPISRRGLDKPELVAADGLHPSGKMYALWVERILKAIL